MELKNISKEKIRDFIRTSPVLFSLGFTLLAILMHEAFSSFFYLLPDTVAMDIAREVVFLIWPVVLVVLFGFAFIFRQRGIRATLGAALPAFLVFGITLLGQVGSRVINPAIEWKSDPEIFLGILMLIGVGFREEILYRGVITNAIARKYAGSAKGIWITALSSSAMFGAIHLCNVFHGATFSGSLSQTLGAMGSGVFFCAVYLRGGSIWVMALLHSLINATGTVEVLFTNGAGDLASVISGYGVMEIIHLVLDLLLAAFLLRKSKQQKIIQRMQQL